MSAARPVRALNDGLVAPGAARQERVLTYATAGAGSMLALVLADRAGIRRAGDRGLPGERLRPSAFKLRSSVTACRKDQDPPAAERLLAALAAQRSTRAFTDEPVAGADLERMIDAARWTGSARNRQPWRFVSVTDRPTKERLGAFGAYAGHLATAPLVLVVLSADDGFADTEFDVGRVVQSLVLAASALGLSSCICIATFRPIANVSVAAALVHAAPGWLPRHALSLGRAAPVVLRGPLAIPAGRLPVAQPLTVRSSTHRG